ncbi:MAG: DUF4376 domain-containing protein [Roseateles sp.]|nr:MAG: DUF4376 domain-containing protein [Roseateles sp.]
MFMKPFTAPNGAVLTAHRVTRAEVTGSGIEFTVQSWPDMGAFQEGKPPLWNSRFNDSRGQDLLASLEASLISGNSEFGGATPIDLDDADLDQARSRRWAAIKAEREARDQAPVDHAGYQVDGDQQSRMDIMGAVLSMQATGQSSRLWRCSDNVMRELTLDDLLAVGTSIASRRQALIETSDQLYQAIQAALTVAEVEAVVWPAE